MKKPMKMKVVRGQQSAGRNRSILSKIIPIEEQEKYNLLIANGFIGIQDNIKDKVVNLLRENQYLTNTINNQLKIIEEHKESYNQLYKTSMHGLVLPNANNVFTFQIDSNKNLNFTFISKKLESIGMNANILEKDVIHNIGKDKFLKLLASINMDNSETIIPTKYCSTISGIEYNISLSATNFEDSIIYGIYLTPMNVFKNELVKTMKVMLSPASIKDPETREHLDRLTDYSELLTRELMNRGLFSDIIDEDYIENISLSAPLHDLGKILVDSSILLKPGKLTEQEFNMMMGHSNLGALIIESEKSKYKGEDLEKLFNIAVNVARHHHEKYNGKGYPDGLKGEKIPLEARIIAVVDVFDALKSNRPYKNEWSDEDIIIEFKKLRGQHFDPIITDIFLELYDEFLQIRQSNDD